MSQPISASRTCAVVGPMPDTWSRRWARYGQAAGEARGPGPGTGLGGVCHGCVATGTAVGALGRADLCQETFDPRGELVDLRAQVVDGLKQQRQQVCVVLLEGAGQRVDQGVVLGLHSPLGETGQDLGATLPGDHGVHHGPPGDPEHVGGHRGQLGE
jgi:hypothetical protein